MKICVGGNANFRVFRHQHVGIANAKFGVGGLSQCKDQMQMFLHHSGIIIGFEGKLAHNFTISSLVLNPCLSDIVKTLVTEKSANINILCIYSRKEI